MTAAHTPQTEIHSDAQDFKLAAAAGVIFLHVNNVAYTNIQRNAPFVYNLQYYIILYPAVQ